jgi:transcription initiation factor TFIIB
MLKSEDAEIPSIDLLSIKFMKDFKKKLNSSDLQIEDSSIPPGSSELEDSLCEKCFGHNIVQSDGYFTCRDCGIQNSIIIDSGQEWRYYGSEDNKADPSRCGMPTSDLLPETSMGSMMGLRGYESYKMKKLRNMQSWSSITYQDNKLLASFKNITAISMNAGISQYIIEEAKHMYKMIYLMKSCKRIKLDVMQAASVQLACKIKGVPRDTIEMATMFNITIRDMRRGSKLFEEVWNSILVGELDTIAEEQRLSASITADANAIADATDTAVIPNKDQQEVDVETIKASEELEDSSLKPSNAMDYLHRNCSKLGLSEEIYIVCKSLCTYIEDNDLLIKHIPVSRTAGCIYFTCIYLKVGITFEAISQVCDISEVTIKKCYQKINKFKKELLENTLLRKYI